MGVGGSKSPGRYNRVRGRGDFCIPSKLNRGGRDPQNALRNQAANIVNHDKYVTYRFIAVGTESQKWPFFALFALFRVANLYVVIYQ
jgi:hypothetical protein